MAATVPVEKAGDTNPLLESAQAIGGPIEANAEVENSNEPAVGSFERFMTSFGSPQRWAGH